MNLIQLTTSEEIKDFFKEKEKVEITEDSKVAVVTDKLRYVKVYAGGIISLIDGKLGIDENKPFPSKNVNKKSQNK